MRTISISAMSSAVVSPSSPACGVDLPQPRRILYEHDPMTPRIPATTVDCLPAPGTGTTMQHQHRSAIGVAAGFPIHTVTGTDIEPTASARFDGRLRLTLAIGVGKAGGDWPNRGRRRKHERLDDDGHGADSSIIAPMSMKSSSLERDAVDRHDRVRQTGFRPCAWMPTSPPTSPSPTRIIGMSACTSTADSPRRGRAQGCRGARTSPPLPSGSRRATARSPSCEIDAAKRASHRAGDRVRRRAARPPAASPA